MTAPGAPSATAQRVAAHRVAFERLPVPFGDAAADDALARDVAGDVGGGGGELMGRYLRARTAFFDRVVVNAIERGVTQIVNLGAGYDGRSLRYAKAGVRWWEVDRADTQRDKLDRLGRLNVDAGHVAFVAHDLTERGLAEALLVAGYDADGTGLFICEGVAAYLEDAVLVRLLSDVRALATVGARLAVSVAGSSTPEREAGRRRFKTAVAGLGEPAVGSATADDLAGLATVTRWRPADMSERAQRAGFLVAVPVWAPASGDQRPTASGVGRFVERMLHRAGTVSLAAHLEATYTVPVTRIRELDLGVHRVERADGTTWIARVFPAVRTVEAVRADAATLDWLAAQDFPSERCASPESVSVHEGQPVLVTQFLAGRKAPANPTTFAALGRLLATLHHLEPPLPLRRPGGAWHHLVTDAGLPAQKAAAIELFTASRSRVAAADPAAFEMFAAALQALDDLADLPHAFTHPDPVPANMIVTESEPALVDWTGAGWAPRLGSLGFLLWAAARSGPACADAAVGGYRTLIRPGEPELARLEQAMTTTPLLLSCWGVATGRQTPERGAASWSNQARRISRAARRAADLFASPDQ